MRLKSILERQRAREERLAPNINLSLLASHCRIHSKNSVRFSYIFSPLDTSCHFVFDSVRFLGTTVSIQEKKGRMERRWKKDRRNFFQFEMYQGHIIDIGSESAIFTHSRKEIVFTLLSILARM